MGNTEIIKLEDQEFKVFKRIPVPIARKVQKLFIDMVVAYTGELDDFETGKVSPKNAKNIDLEILDEIYDLLLTKTVLSPKISKEDIDNIEHDLQYHFQELADLLLKRFTDHKASIKKKSMNSPS